MTRYFLVSLLLFTIGCSSKNQSENTVIDNAIDTQLQLEHPEAGNEPERAKIDLFFENGKAYYYAGIIDIYSSQIVMKLVANGNDITGTYYYSTRQKELQLKGQINLEDQSIELEESYKGKTSGYFSGYYSESSIKGTWKDAKNEDNSADFNLSKLSINSKTIVADKQKFKQYKLEHESGLYNSETDDYDLYTTEDKINISYIDHATFDFYYSVNGMNGHSGSIAGLANMKTEKEGYYTDQNGCELTFIFNKDTIEILASGCEDYSGMRAHFGGKLAK
ncbi:MAG: hypothetical protein AB8B74_06595 [Crocinitomicaceae bacterium]